MNAVNKPGGKLTSAAKNGRQSALCPMPIKRYALTPSHRLCGIDLCPSGNDLTLTNPLQGGGTGERLLELDREVDILEKDRLDGDTPFLGSSLDLHISFMSAFSSMTDFAAIDRLTISATS